MFSQADRDKCCQHGINVEESYRQMLLEIRVGGPVMNNLLTSIEGNPVRLHSVSGRTHGPTSKTNDPTARQLEVLEHIADGGTVRTAALNMGVAYETASTLLQRAKMRVGARNTTHAVAIAIRRGLIEAPPKAGGAS